MYPRVTTSAKCYAIADFMFEIRPVGTCVYMVGIDVFVIDTAPLTNTAKLRPYSKLPVNVSFSASSAPLIVCWFVSTLFNAIFIATLA